MTADATDPARSGEPGPTAEGAAPPEAAGAAAALPSPADATRTSAHTVAPGSAAVDSMDAPPQLDGRARYHILAEHGRGGLGRVSRAHDRELGRDIAIKELISRNQVSEVRFLREALITARLEHPGIVPVYEAGRWPDGTPFYAMKLVSGRPLRELIAERLTVDERIGLLHHVIALADAIAYAHGRNIIHRDLKPSNVIVGDFGETVVIDWGLAKDLSATEESSIGGGPFREPRDDGLTSAGAVLGTPAYMAPEQARGEPVDQRADVYAIGAMLWELCALERVPPADPAQRRRMLRRARIDDDLATIIAKAIDPDASRRYRDAGALAADLKAFKAGARITARRYSLAGILAHWTRQHRMLAVSTAAFVVLVALLLRSAVQARLADRLATESELEQGRQALLHGDSGDAIAHLERAYQRGDHSPGLVFMLARALQPRLSELQRFASSAGRMWSAAFSPDGTRVLTTDDASARMWDAASGRALFTMSHGDTVYQAVFSPDGARILTAGGDGTVRIWNAATGAAIRALTGPGPDAGQWRYSAVATTSHFVAAIDTLGRAARVWDADTGAQVVELANDEQGSAELAISSDGRWMATTGGDDIHVFDTSTWQRAVTIAGPRVRSLCFDPSGAYLAVGTYDGVAAIWQVATGERIRRLREAGESVDAVAFSADGRLLATGSRDGTEQVWDATTGGLRSERNFHHSKIYAVEFSSTGDRLLSASADGAVVVSHVATGMLEARLEGPGGLVIAAHFAPDSRRVVGAAWDGTARVWDATSPYRRWSEPPIGPECSTADYVVPDQRFVALSCPRHGTRVWDTARDRRLADLPEVTAVGGGYYSAYPAVTAAGDRAAIVRNQRVEIYELPGGRLVRSIAHAAPVNTVAFAPAGHDLISGAIDGSLLLARDDRDPIALPSSAAGIDTAVILAGGRIVVADASRRLRVLDPGRGATELDVVTPARVRLLRPSADDRWLITLPTSNEPVAPALWDLEHGRLAGRLEGHVGRVFNARFVASGREILTAGSDGTARLWDATTGALHQTFRGDSHFLPDAVLSPDGALVVAGGSDGLLRFWDASNARMLWTLPVHKSYVIGVHYEGSDLVTRGFAGDVARWTLPDARAIVDRLPALRGDAQPDPR